MIITTTTGEIVTARKLLELSYDKTEFPNHQYQAFFSYELGLDVWGSVYITKEEYARLAALIEGRSADQQAEAHATQIAILTGELEAARTMARKFAKMTQSFGHDFRPDGEARCRGCLAVGRMDQIMHLADCPVGKASQYLRATEGENGND